MDFYHRTAVKLMFNLDESCTLKYISLMKDDYVWDEAVRAFRRRPHDPVRMLQVSRGALFTYCCPVCSEAGVGLLCYSTTSSVRTCYGGYAFD